MKFRCSVAAAAAAVLVVVAGPAGAADFYKGKTVTMMIPSGLGAMPFS